MKAVEAIIGYLTEVKTLLFESDLFLSADAITDWVHIAVVGS